MMKTIPLPLAVCLLFILIVSTPACAIDNSQIREGRLHAYNVVSTLLMYYNPHYDNRDSKVQAHYRDELTKLQGWNRNNGNDRKVQKLVTEIAAQIADLEQQPEERAQIRPVWINRILQLQATLDEYFASLVKGDNTSVGTLADTLGIYLAMQNLGYQITTFGSVNFYLLDGRTDMMEELDRLIASGLEQIQGQSGSFSPVQLEALDKLQSRYRFIRPRLTGHQQDWVPNLIAYYCKDMLELTERL
jgi:hypothetical protein